MKPGSNRGKKNFKSKLSDEDVAVIYKSTDTQSKLAKRFNVSQSTVNHIKKGRTWNWLTEKL